MGPAVRVVDVRRSFGTVDALIHINLDVDQGSCVGIVGHNGSGKSTLLQLIAGRLRPSSGQVEVGGIDLSTPDGRRHARTTVAVGGTVAAFYPDLTVREHLELVAIAHGLDAVRSRADTILADFNLTSRAEALPGQLSTGMRQKLDLALALVRPSRVLILDEPDRGLDPAARTKIWRDVADYKASGRTVIVATHQLGGLDGLFDQVVLLEAGVEAGRGSLDELRRTAAGQRLGLDG